MEAAGVGHNRAPFDFGAFVDAVLASTATTQQKLIQIVIGRQADKGGGSATPKRNDVLKMASCSEATFKRSYDLLKSAFEITPRHGSTTEYTPKPCVTVCEVEAAVTALKGKTQDHGEPGSPSTRYQKAGISVTPGAQSAPLSATEVSQSDRLPDTDRKKEIPPVPPKEKNIIIPPVVPQVELSENGVKVNGTAIYVRIGGRKMEFDYGTIDMWAALNLCPPDTAKSVVDAVARGWVIEGKFPDAPTAMMRRQIAKWRLYRESDDAEIRRKSGPAPHKPALLNGSTPKTMPMPREETH